MLGPSAGTLCCFRNVEDRALEECGILCPLWSGKDSRKYAEDHWFVQYLLFDFVDAPLRADRMLVAR